VPADGPPKRAGALECVAAGRWVWLLLCAVAAMPYAASLGGGFVSDDLLFVRDSFGLARTPWAFLTATFDVYYRPVYALSMAADCRLWGSWSPGWHLTNVAIHALATLAAFSLLLRLAPSRGLALLAAIVFALQPCRVESVAWISGRNDSLCTLFCLWAVVWHLRAIEAPSWRRHALVAAFAALAAFAKEAGLVVLPLLVLAEWLSRRTVGRDSVWGRAARLGPAVLAVALYVTVHHHVTGGALWRASAPAESPSGGLGGAMAALGHYAAMALCAEPPLRWAGPVLADPMASPWAWAGLAAGLAWLAALVRHRRLGPGLSFSLAWAGVCLAPALVVAASGGALVPSSLWSGRYLYAPAWGLCLPLALMIHRSHVARPRLTRRLVSMAVVAYLVVCAVGCLWYRSSSRFWALAASTSPEWAMGHAGHGESLLRSGDPARAAAALARAVQLDTARGDYAVLLARALTGSGDPGGALAAARHALARLSTTRWRALEALGDAHAALAEPCEALRCYRRALRHAPHPPGFRPPAWVGLPTPDVTPGSLDVAVLARLYASTSGALEDAGHRREAAEALRLAVGLAGTTLP